MLSEHFWCLRVQVARRSAARNPTRWASHIMSHMAEYASVLHQSYTFTRKKKKPWLKWLFNGFNNHLIKIILLSENVCAKIWREFAHSLHHRNRPSCQLLGYGNDSEYSTIRTGRYFTSYPTQYPNHTLIIPLSYPKS